MTTPKASEAEFFEAKYKERADPWDFASSHYELQRYDAIVAALNHRYYKRAFEPGCSVGVLTERLASVCDRVVAIDFSVTAVAQAAARCSRYPGVEVHCAPFTDYLPADGFDLIVLSEIGYYFQPKEWRAVTSAIVEAMDTGSTLLAAHWLGHSKDHQMNGDEVHAILSGHAQLRLELAERHASFRIDRWVRV